MKSAVRKVVRVGKRSYAVVLPKKWSHLLKIRPGDPAYIVMNDDGTLTIAPLRTSRDVPIESGVRVSLSPASTDSRIVTKVVLALYSAGLSNVILEAEVPLNALPLPNELARVEITRDGAVVGFRELRVDPGEVLETMVRKVREAFKLFSENLEKLSPEIWGEIHKIENELDAMVHIVARLTIRKVIAEALSKGVGSEALTRSILDVLVARILEDLSDCVDRSAHRVKELSVASRDYRDLYAKLLSLSDEAMVCYLHRCSVDDVVLNLGKASKLREELKELMAISTPSLLPLLSEVEVALTLVEDLLETTLVMAYG